MTGGIGRWRTPYARACIFAATIVFSTPSMYSQADDATDFSKASGDLKAAIDTFAKSATVDRVKKAESAPRGELIDGVKDNIGTLTSYEQIDLFDAFAVEMARLKTTLIAIAKDEKKLDALRAINRVDPNAKDKAERFAAIDKENGAKLGEAIATLYAISTAIGPSSRVNIVGAWYGDIDTIRDVQPKYAWSGGVRFCSATAAVQAFCEGRSACFTVQPGGTTNESQSTTGTAGDVGPAKLCGYNPVPYASDDTKALIVFYRCLAGGDEAWRAQDEINWREVDWRPTGRLVGKSIVASYAAPSDTPITPSTTTDVRAAVLRNNAIGEIRCYRGDLGQ